MKNKPDLHTLRYMFANALGLVAVVIVFIWVTRQRRRGGIPDTFSNSIASPSSSSCSLYHTTGGSGSCRSQSASPLLPVNDPEHNLREIVKQLILLEDHLFQTDKQCVQCIAKHLFGIEAYAEEGISLDITKRYVTLFRNIIVATRDLQRTWQKDPTGAAQRVRELRRSLMGPSALNA